MIPSAEELEYSIDSHSFVRDNFLSELFILILNLVVSILDKAFSKVRFFSVKIFVGKSFPNFVCNSTSNFRFFAVNPQ